MVIGGELDGARVTGVGMAENAHAGFELIQKPYSVESLSRVLRKAIIRPEGG